MKKLKVIISNISFKIFLWSINLTKEDYWFEVYKSFKNKENNKLK